MHYHAVPRGVCARSMDFDITDDNKISNLTFRGGCAGNLLAIGKLLEGADVEETISLLEGTTCGPRPTSCSDQLTKALRAALNGELEPSSAF